MGTSERSEAIEDHGVDALEVDQDAYAPQFYPLQEDLQVCDSQNSFSRWSNTVHICGSFETVSRIRF